jgi:hypothetical protein
MKRLTTLAAFAAALGAASSALAAGSTAQVGPMTVTGNVPALCTGGTVGNDTTVFPVGTLIDTGTGLLLPNLSSPDKTVNGSFCNTRSTITVSATRMTAQAFTGTPPVNFSKSVDFTATASGWTTTAAVFNTVAGATNSAATQTQNDAFTGPITIGVSNFATSGGTSLRLVSDPNYVGTVTVTLTVAS